MTVKYPNIEVELSASDGNAMMIVGKVAKALRQGGVSAEDIKTFQEKALSGDYDNVLRTAMEYVEVS